MKSGELPVECSTLTVPLLCETRNTLTKNVMKITLREILELHLCLLGMHMPGMHNNCFQSLQCPAGQRSLFKTRNFIYFITIGIGSFEMMLVGVSGFIYFIPLGLKLLSRLFYPKGSKGNFLKTE